MERMNLNTNWIVRYEGLEIGPEMAALVQNAEHNWMEAELPCDVHMPLIANGIIRDPVERDYCFESEWIEEKSWWFKKKFILEEQDFISIDAVELELESLDARADIFLNGIHLGHQMSAFYPFVKEVKSYLRTGENVLLVRVTSGLEHVCEEDLARIKKNICAEFVDERRQRGDLRRVCVRKPQYAYGWDWGPRVATCGIMKGVSLYFLEKYAIRSVYGYTVTIDPRAIVHFEVEIDNLHPYSTKEAILEINMQHKGIQSAAVKQEVYLQSGMNYIDLQVEIEHPELWWPNGMGNPNLYKVEVSVVAADGSDQYEPFFLGIRTLKLDTDRINTERRQFGVVINGRKVFAKGGNWIPADSIYARVTEEKYTTLIQEAAQANLNLLRVWGGGFFEQDIFYQRCDENGIMVWQDFMFACALYPDDQTWFREEFEKESQYQTRKLRNHSSLVLWCGNNENHTAYSAWWTGERTPKFFGGAHCYHQIAPAAVRRNCKEIPYWSGSPYGGQMPHDLNEGDVHPWGQLFMNEDMDKRVTPEVYDTVTASFVSEYGYVGPCTRSSTIQYLGGAEMDRTGSVWDHHNNTFEKETVNAGIRKHYADPEKLDTDGYFLYAGLCQGLMLGYSLEAFRNMEYCQGGMFWMYNDCWGEVGWTIIDYYLRRKVSYYFVQRAFEPFKLILREKDGRILVRGINETAEPFSTKVEYGFVSLDGSEQKVNVNSLYLPEFSRGEVLAFDKQTAGEKPRVYYVKQVSGDNRIQTAILREKTFREMHVPTANVKIEDVQKTYDSVSFTVSSSSFAHAVYFNIGDGARASDMYFDLLPGESKRITVYGSDEHWVHNGIRAYCV